VSDHTGELVVTRRLPPENDLPDEPVNSPPDSYTRGEGVAEMLDDDHLLIVCASTHPVAMGSETACWLDMSAADLSLLRTGRAPLLFGHDYSLDSILGAVERAWVDGDSLYVTARWASSPRAMEARALVQARILRNVSIGMWHRTDTEPDGTGATRVSWWRPHEVSLVAVPRNWGARIIPKTVPLRVRRALLASLAETNSGTPETWRNWARAAAGPLAQHAGLSPERFDALLSDAVEAELQRLAREAAERFSGALGVAPLRGDAPC
jgi:hypothetical protein